jgi:hypothetical protein
MPILSTRSVLDVTRSLSIFLNLEAGATRSGEDSFEPAEDHAQKLKEAEARITRQRRVIGNKDRQIALLKEKLENAQPDSHSGGVLPGNIVWMFGHGRTGSTWLSRMMEELDGYSVWFEPNVGKLFGDFYYNRALTGQRASKNFILGDRQRRTWVGSIRSLVMEGIAGRFPKVGKDEHLVVKEPGGSIGAPLLSEALPESRMIFLIRDPRDTVSSALDAFKKGNWAYERTHQDKLKETELATDRPDEFVKVNAGDYAQQMGNAWEAYSAHQGPKVLVKYEDLRADTFGTMKRIYSELELSVNEEDLARAVEKHSWESLPEKRKGEGKFYRKATPGGWSEDLTSEQARVIEEITAPLLKEFYLR